MREIVKKIGQPPEYQCTDPLKFLKMTKDPV